MRSFGNYPKIRQSRAIFAVDQVAEDGLANPSAVTLPRQEDAMGLFAFRRDRRCKTLRRPRIESLETRELLSLGTLLPVGTPPAAEPTLTQQDVQTLLDRAARLTPGDNAIVTIVDRGGNLLGVRVEGNVSTAITGNTEKLVYSVDGSLAEARTGAFFASNQGPLTSRTVQDIAQSTITQSEVQSDPNITDPNSPLRGPGFVAPIGLKAHFPPRVEHTPTVDLFEIEHTNRDSIIHTGANGIRGSSEDIRLPSRFNVPTQFIPAGQQYLPPGFQLTNPGDTPDSPPESYGFISGLLPSSQSRGIGTLPGGVPIFKDGHLVGGIGVFFPGTTGEATEENSALNDAGFFDPTKPDLSAVAEYVAFAAVGGSSMAGASYNTPKINAKLGLEPLPAAGKFDLPFGRIDLVGITLNLFGNGGLQGPTNVVSLGRTLPLGNATSGTNFPVDTMGDTLLPGTLVPQGWLVIPHNSADGGITAADVVAMVERGVAEAEQVRSAIRVPFNRFARMVFAVTDNEGNVLGLYRMPDATFFSIDVAVAKARNVAYYANPTQLQTIDQVPGVPKGVAMTNRTFRYLAQPRFPQAVDGNPPGPFSILNDVGVRNGPTPLPASAYQSVQGFDAFNPQTNFRDPFNIANQNGIVFFPGSAPLYKSVAGGTPQLVGGLGVSGDGVDQDDDVTFEAAQGFQPPPTVLRADQVKVRGARLPYQKFNRQPHFPIGTGAVAEPKIQPPVLPRNGHNQAMLTAADLIRLQRSRARFVPPSR
jgi:uncharacterized protein GlcG (DUF336 family)